jgi:hypothetical protein
MLRRRVIEPRHPQELPDHRARPLDALAQLAQDFTLDRAAGLIPEIVDLYRNSMRAQN